MITIQKFYEMRILFDRYPNPKAKFESEKLRFIAVQMEWLLNDLDILDRQIVEMFNQSKIKKENE